MSLPARVCLLLGVGAIPLRVFGYMLIVSTLFTTLDNGFLAHKSLKWLRRLRPLRTLSHLYLKFRSPHVNSISTAGWSLSYSLEPIPLAITTTQLPKILSVVAMPTLPILPTCKVLLLFSNPILHILQLRKRHLQRNSNPFSLSVLATSFVLVQMPWI